MPITAQTALQWSEQGYVPDKVIRHGIRRLLAERLIEIQHDNCSSMADTQHHFVKSMKEAEIAVVPQKANEQHYEVPAKFFDLVLGKHRKYSCCYWPDGVDSLDKAEAHALEETCRHAKLENGQDILELGCGWGSLSLWMAGHYPDSRITAVSNSHSQREHIERMAAERGIDNLNIITCDMNDFDIDQQFDRIVSVEMFEHMRNWSKLYENVSRWLTDDGLFFKHIFVNRGVPYLFLELDDSDWMSRHFFSGGMMPSDDLPLHFQQHLTLQRQWRWQGTHYEKTSNAWLSNMDANKELIWPILENTYGKDQAQKWWMRWRMFFMACAELFAFNNGQEWYVSHYLLEKRER
jgi:cyclopropane-fatty-acyl-phospholipid synthase